MNINPLLRTLIPAELRDEWATRLARREESEVVGQLSVLSFRLGEETFCLPSRRIEEISTVGVIQPLPHTKNGLVRGITNVRGQIRLCVWLSRLLDVSAAANPPAPRLILFIHNGWRVATVVDEIIGTELLDPAERRVLPSTHSGAVYAEGWFPQQSVAMLNETKFFNGLRQQLR